MPALSSASLLNTLVPRNVTATGNATNHTLQVICAFPVSGQYGPGSRILYYVLIAACVFARKSEWLKTACLAAALLFPAVAALHGIVLAALHVDGAVDMDIYGAFQLCSIGILAAPVTVMLSTTYFYDPGRNIIFVWTGLVLSGLLSLTVEFFRVNPSPCPTDNNGNPITSIKSFPYGNTTCGLTCDVNLGPFSPLRQGSANNIYVIPTPQRLTVDTATLFAAGCCIPAILSLVSMWKKILEINWKDRFGDKNQEEIEKSSEDRDGAELEQSKTKTEAIKNADIKKMNEVIRFFLRAVEVPVFGAAVFAILIMGERNFWSQEVYYQTEPIKAIGQWAPIAGTTLAILGSLYVLAATRGSKPPTKNEEKPNTPEHHRCDCLVREDTRGRRPTPRSPPHSSPPNFGDISDASNLPHSVIHDEKGYSQEIDSQEIEMKPQSLTKDHRGQVKKAEEGDAGYRRTVAKGIYAIFKSLGTAAPDMFDDSGFKLGKSGEFPETPGEGLKNDKLEKTKEEFRKIREADGHYRLARAASFAASVRSRRSDEDLPETSRAASPHPPRVLRSQTEFLSPSTRVRNGTWPAVRPSSDVQGHASSSRAGAGMVEQHEETSQEPLPLHHSSLPTNNISPPIGSDGELESPGSPIIVISSDDTTWCTPSPRSERLPPAT
ncbi:hypothetical protein BDZ45DRAFT_594913 [Acephala macrosclerotiorum]|nr:hypothetical protein BDZ45DRAFT_594913 [Acephala macrosclerotiorum]